MGCGSCNKKEKTPGCGSKTGYCVHCENKSTVNWLAHMGLSDAGTTSNLVEVRFRHGYKKLFRNTTNITLDKGDAVLVSFENDLLTKPKAHQKGYHLGYVELWGSLAEQKRKNQEVIEAKIGYILRLATDQDLKQNEAMPAKEAKALALVNKLVVEFKLEMNPTQVEYWADGTKTVFYYSAAQRVDFRPLIYQLAKELHTRIEMRQISLREEASRIGGIGICGRELCCATWLTGFPAVRVEDAGLQQLSVNPVKLAGRCGRLRCCINYELDTYAAYLQKFPTISNPLKTTIGDAKLEKTDLFKNTLWFSYEDGGAWQAVSIERVKEIQTMNASNQTPYSLEENQQQTNTPD